MHAANDQPPDHALKVRANVCDRSGAGHPTGRRMGGRGDEAVAASARLFRDGLAEMGWVPTSLRNRA